MTTRLKHTDDDGDLSIFVSGGEILFACNHGHAWTTRVSVELHTPGADLGPTQCSHEGPGSVAAVVEPPQEPSAERPAERPVEHTTAHAEPDTRNRGPAPPSHGAA